MKKINKWIFFTLTLISSTFLPYLTINAKATTNIPRAKTWTEDSGNIKNGRGSFMFEDKRGNLWSAGYGTALQKYDYSTSMWKTSDDIAGNLKNGRNGFMFEDSRRNLWSAGWESPIQKYNYDISRWETSPAITGNLKHGDSGFMFEDSKSNLWSVGYGTALQKYDYSTRTWDSSAPVSGNLKNGREGFMFQDKRGNLWSAGYGTALQKYDYGTSRWGTNNDIAGNISYGGGGFMFEDRKGNLWSAGHNTPLQKYDYIKNKWKTSPEIAGNISDGRRGFMFQDKRGNLWSAGYGTALQKYDYGTSRWEAGPAIEGNIGDGRSGFMFQDKRGNLWSAGVGTDLQKYDYSANRWKISSPVRGNLSNGWKGFMFEDSKGNLWSAGYGTALQVLYSDKDVSSVIALIQANTGMTKDTTDAISPVDIDMQFDANVLSLLGIGGTFPSNTKDTTLTYAHGGITSDGPLVVTVKITKGTATASATFTVDVSGINAAKKDKIQEANLQALKTQLTGGAVTKITDKVGAIAVRIKDAASLKAGTGIDLSRLTASSTYAILASGDKDTGIITVSVIMTTDGATVPKSPPVTHNINHKSDAAIDAEVQNNADAGSIKTIIEAITGVKKTSNVDIPVVAADTPFDVVAFKTLGGSNGVFPGTKGTTLTYSHGGITSDGDLTVTVKITKGAATASATFTVDVSGIDVVKKDKIQEANLQALKTQLTGGAVTKITDKVGAIAVRIKDAASLKAETGIDLTKLANSSTYVISAAANGTSGTITISVIMTTSGAASEISEVVTYTFYHKSNDDVDAANKADVVDTNSIKVTIENIIGMTKDIADAISPVDIDTLFDANALSSLGTGGTFPSDIKDTTLTYAHGGITSDGDLTVTVKITKGKATAFANFNIAIGGINLGKVKKEANKFKNFNSPDSLNSVAALLPQNIEDIKTQFEAITGYKAPSLTDGYSISRVIVQTALDPKTKKVVYTVTISDTNSIIATKDIVVTFAVTQNKSLSGEVIAGITIGSVLGVGILGFLIYYYFKKLKKQK